jgi:DNA repair exonuclease SbcCD nuclease subunit
MAFRFVHAADLHLDSPLRSLALARPELAALVGTASRDALSAIIDLCLEERVDALLIAGDLYDGDQTSMKTARFLADELQRLHQAGIRTFIIRGNHDALSRISKQLTLPETVKVFGSKAGIEVIENEASSFPVAIHGLSFKEPHAPASLLSHYRPAVTDAINIGLMHTSLDGAPGHDLYGPCSVAELRSIGFRYWALGHIHKRRVVDGACTVVMPGMTQGRDIGEAGPKSATIVTIADDRTLAIAEHQVSGVEFQTVEVDVSGAQTWQDSLRAIDACLSGARSKATSETLIARLRVKGMTPLSARLRWDRTLLLAEAERAADALRRTFVEKLDICVTDPHGTTQAGDQNPVPELRQIITNEVLSSESYREALLLLADELKRELPPDCADRLRGDPTVVCELLDQLATDGAEDVLARLQEQSSELPSDAT